MKKYLLPFLLGAIFFGGLALGAPSYIYQRTILPEITNTYELGTSTRVWKDIYATTFHGDGSLLTGIGSFTTTTINGLSSTDYLFAAGSNLILSTSSPKTITFAVTSTPAFTSLTTTGNVGIGTTNPTGKLEVAGMGTTDDDVVFKFSMGSNDTSHSATDFRVGSPASSWGGIRFSNPSSNVTNLEFSNWNGSARTVRMGIYGTSGNVGIGTTTPSTTLYVNGSTTISNGLTLTGLSNTFLAVDSTGKIIATSTPSGTGITSLNGSTSSTQTFAIASSSNTYSIVTSNGVHTLTIPNNLGWFTNDSGYLTSTLSANLFGGGYNLFNIGSIGSSTQRISKLWATDLDATTATIGTLTVSSLVNSPLVVGGTATTTIYGNGTTSVFGGAISATGYNNTNWDTAYTNRYWTLSNGLLYPTSTAYKVGIGNNFPTSTLHVTGETTLNGILSFGAIATTTNYSVFINEPALHTLAFNTAGSEAMRITNTGNVGIGTTGPAYKLVVVGTSTSDGAIIGSDTGIVKRTSGAIGTATAGVDYQVPISAGSNIVLTGSSVAVTSTPSWAQITLTGDNNTVKYGEKVLCNLMFSYATSTSSWYDDCFVPVTSTITRVKSKVQDGAVTWNLFYKNTAASATTTGMYPVFSSNITSNTTTTVVSTPTASSTPNDTDFIRIYATTASSTEFSIMILGKDR